MDVSRAASSFVLSFVLAVAACSTSDDGGGGAGGTGGSGGAGGGTGEAVIGPEGGSLTTTDGSLTLTVPPGALGEAVEIRIEPIALDQAPTSVQALAGSLTVYDLQPAGLQFASPARLGVTVPDVRSRDSRGITQQIAFLLAESENVVEALGNQSYALTESNTTDAELTADISHFSTAIVQLFEGATFSATVPTVVDAAATFDVTVTVDIDGAGLGTINQAVQEDASMQPVNAGPGFDGDFAGSDTVQTSANTYSCTGGGDGLYRTIVGFEVDNDLGPITAVTLAADVACSQNFEIMDDRPADIGRAEGSPIAAYSTGPGVTVLNIATGEVLQRVGRTDTNMFGFPTSAANVYAPTGQIQAVIATTSAGVEGAIFGAAALSREGFAFIPSEMDGSQGGNEGGLQNLQYAPGRFASIGGSAFFFDIGDTGLEPRGDLNAAFAGAGELRLLSAYVQPQGFTEASPMLALRTKPGTNPAVEPPELVRLSLANDSVAVDPIDEGVPGVLTVPLGSVVLNCLPDPEAAQAAICGITGLGSPDGGLSLFRWLPAELPRLSIQGIASSVGSFNGINIDSINTDEGTRFATATVQPEIRVDDVEAGLSAGGLTTQTVATPGECGPAVDVEFRNANSLLVSCLNRDFVVTLDLPAFGAGGSGGSGGSGGEGGSGGACTDDIGPRPTLTAAPTVSATTVSPGDQISLQVSVSAEARYVRVRVFDGFSAIAAEAETTTSGSEMLQFDLTISESATIGFDLFVGILLCDDVNCLTNPDPDQISYTRPGSTSGAGDPYFVSVREDGFSRPDISTLSCFDLLVLDVVAP